MKRRLGVGDGQPRQPVGMAGVIGALVKVTAPGDAGFGTLVPPESLQEAKRNLVLQGPGRRLGEFGVDRSFQGVRGNDAGKILAR